MRDLYEERLMLGHNAAVPPRLNPFFDPSENQTFVGVANIFLEALYEEVALNYQAPIISPQGEVVGRLVVELERIGAGLLLQDRLGQCESNSEDSRNSSQGDEEAPSVTVRLAIKEVTGVSPAFSHFVCCEYVFWGDSEVTRVPPILDRPRPTDNRHIKFEHHREVSVTVTEELLEHLAEGALSIEVYGQQVGQDDSISQATARSLADRWQELTKKVEVRVEVQELNDAGEYAAVEVVTREESGTGGVLQLRQGQQRRLGVSVATLPDSGLLPLVY